MKKNSFFLFWSILLIDIGLKRFICLHLSIQDTISLFQNFFGISFDLCHVTNRGAAWGIWEGWPLALNLVRIGLIIGLLFYIGYSTNWVSRKPSPSKSGRKLQNLQTPLILVAAGGIGNLIDYFLYGHVIDMFHLTFWRYSYPVFNIADAAICIGVFCFLYRAYKPTKRVPSENIPPL